jgi:hypothetical protein
MALSTSVIIGGSFFIPDHAYAASCKSITTTLFAKHPLEASVLIMTLIR